MENLGGSGNSQNLQDSGNSENDSIHSVDSQVYKNSEWFPGERRFFNGFVFLGNSGILLP